MLAAFSESITLCSVVAFEESGQVVERIVLREDVVVVFRFRSPRHDDDAVAGQFGRKRGAACGVFGLCDLRECRRGGERKQREEPCESHARLECGLCAGSVMRSLPESCQPVAVR